MNAKISRILMHFACALLNHEWRWHMAGIMRELRAARSHE